MEVNNDDRGRTVVSEHEVFSELARIKASPTFATSPRLVQLLEYLIKESFAGRCGQIKAYSIGIDVFGRSDQFDPSSDAIVRVHAARLREALAEYYRQSVTQDVVISLPKGAYCPAFERASVPHFGSATEGPTDSEDVRSRSWQVRSLSQVIGHLRSIANSLVQTPPSPSVLCTIAAIGIAWVLIAMNTSRTSVTSHAAINSIGIIPFEDRSGSHRMQTFVRAVEGTIASLLVTAGDFTVRIGPMNEGQLPRSARPPTTGAQLPVRWLLMGELLDFSGKIQLNARLTDAETRIVLWLGTVDVNDSSDAAAISMTLIEQMRPNLFLAIRSKLEAEADTTRDPLELFFLANWAWGSHQSSLKWETERIAFARQAIQQDPRFGPAYGVLADKVAYLAKVEPQFRTERYVKEARSAALKAIELAPRHSETTFNVALHYWHTGDMVEARAFIRRTLDLNPAHIMAKLQAMRLHSVCDSNPEVIEQLLLFDSRLPKTSSIRWVSLLAMMEQYVLAGRMDDAVAAGLASMRDFSNPVHAIWVAAALANVGKTEEAERLLSQQRQSWPGLSVADYASGELKRRCGNDPSIAMRRFFQKVALL